MKLKSTRVHRVFLWSKMVKMFRLFEVGQRSRAALTNDKRVRDVDEKSRVISDDELRQCA